MALRKSIKDWFERNTAWSHRYDQAIWLIWLFLLVSIPVTSFPLVAKFLNKTPVSPMALIPLAALCITWLAPYILRGRKLPATLWPLFIFVVIAIISTSLALTLPLYPYKGQTVVSRGLRALTTLAIGLAFYLCGAVLPSSDAKRKQSLVALNFGAIATLLWASLQVLFVLDGVREVPDGLNALHRMFSIRDLLHNRVVGLAYEPSWLGDQLVLLYLPLWLSSIFKGYSVFPRFRKYISFELAMSIWGMLILFKTQSRISFISLAVMLASLYLVWYWRATGRFIAKLRKSIGWAGLSADGILRPLLLLFGILGLVIVAITFAWLSSRIDYRMRNLFVISSQMDEIRTLHPYEVGYEVANRFAFAERVAYWGAGYRIFEMHPMLGVGLGNAGFLFNTTMPAIGHRLAEIRDALDPANPNFLNPKNLWVRLLAETGFVGFSAYLTWVILLASSAYTLFSQQDRLSQMLGLAGLLSITALLFEGFSLDSFALPQMWIVFGLVTASSWKSGASSGTYG